ncbi:UNVERIFIED_CONTAM: putative protein arginine N-methyltransferase 3 [Sesamum radiatum]|uniref:Methyltransferase type 11 domain-containing protein n=1 Tax=Sesamum radiatum TaxID=300843 RepID=A0AAW2VI72_SESRA
MATHRGEEEKLTDAKLNLMRHYSDSEEDEVEDQNWDDWEVEGEAEDEQGSNPQLRCLFCDSLIIPAVRSSSTALRFTASTFMELRKPIAWISIDALSSSITLGARQCLSFLVSCLQTCCTMASNKCWSCGKKCDSKEELQNHLHEERPSEGSILPWDDEKYLNPFLQDDALLYSFDEDDEYEDEDAVPVDSEELAIHLSQFEHINIDDEGTSDRYASELMQPSANGAKEVQFTVNEITNHVKSSGRLVENGVSTVTNGISSFRNTETIGSSKIAANEITNINKKYFGSYSSFGIHRDMISDKVRTDAYRQAILENPSLLRGSVVMDVGCGTGILSLFAAQAGAARVIAIEASEKMAGVATQIAKDNGLLQNGLPGEDSKCNGVIEVVQGMVEELPNADHIKPHSVDVLLSEWMGYCLLYESMLSSVLFARDRWLKPGGAILPDTATMVVFILATFTLKICLV